MILASVASDRLRFVTGTAAGWHFWDGQRWQPDPGFHVRQEMATVVMKHISSLAIAKLVPESTFTEMQRSAGQEGALKLASSMPEFAITHNELDNQPHLLNCQNGTLDLTTLELRPHDPDDLLTQITTAAFDPSAHSQEWEDFLSTALPDTQVREYLQRLIGYSLLGEVIDHVFPLLVGEGGNGKGTMYETIVHALGDYAAPASSSLLIQSRSDYLNADNAAPAMLALKGKRFVVTSETPVNARLAVDRMKFLTGGDTITARGLYARTSTVFRPSHTLFMVTNHEPMLDSEDAAAWQRITTIPFNVRFRGTDREIPGLAARLRDSSGAVLSWAVEGLRHYRTQGLAAPREVLSRTAQYHAKTDHVSGYITARLVPTSSPSDRIPRTEMWNDWLAYSRAEGTEPGKQSEFYQRIEREFPASKYSGTRVFTGVAFADSGMTTHLDDDDILSDLGNE